MVDARRPRIVLLSGEADGEERPLHVLCEVTAWWEVVSIARDGASREAVVLKGCNRITRYARLRARRESHLASHKAVVPVCKPSHQFARGCMCASRVTSLLEAAWEARVS